MGAAGFLSFILPPYLGEKKIKERKSGPLQLSFPTKKKEEKKQEREGGEGESSHVMRPFPK